MEKLTGTYTQMEKLTNCKKYSGLQDRKVMLWGILPNVLVVMRNGE